MRPVLVYSVAHTGTRFTMAFLDSLGVQYDQKHSDLSPSGYRKIVVPYRDPAKQFVSLFKRHNELRGFDELLDLSVSQWRMLGEKLDGLDHVKIRIDNPDTSQLQVVADYLGGEYKNVEQFGWPIMHPLDGVPSSIDELSDERKLIALDRLGEYRSKYGYE